MGACVSHVFDHGLAQTKSPSKTGIRASSKSNLSKMNGLQNPPSLPSHPLAEPKEFTFSYNNRKASTVVSMSSVLNDLNSYLLSAFGLSVTTHVVTGVLVNVTGPLIPFFMLPYLHSNTPDNPYPVIVALLKDFGIDNWGTAPDDQEQKQVTMEWTEIEEIMEAGGESEEKLYSLPASALLAARFYELLRQYGYVRLCLPPNSPCIDIVQSAMTVAHDYFSQPMVEKRKKHLGFHQHKFVGYSYTKGSARQFIQLRTTKKKVTDNGEGVPTFDVKLTDAYLTLQNIAYQLFKLLCHPHLTSQTHLSPELYSTLLDAPCPSAEALNDCSSVADNQFVGTNVFRIYQYLRHVNSSANSRKKIESQTSDYMQTPGFLGAATSVHADMGLLTVSPQSNLPGLTILKHSDASRWVNVEMKSSSTCVDGSDLDKNYVYVFIGETLAQLTKGSLLAPVHFVDERTPTQPRFSMPFFLRARQKCVLPAVEGMCEEMTVDYFMTKVLQQRKQVWGHKPTTDY